MLGNGLGHRDEVRTWTRELLMNEVDRRARPIDVGHYWVDGQSQAFGYARLEVRSEVRFSGAVR